ncbi:MAG TPA: hypothetical protein VFH54_15250 [Mycobacteriales bacterium]|nr:hypothetical protein [Mycobacteriales bacterium]
MEENSLAKEAMETLNRVASERPGGYLPDLYLATQAVRVIREKHGRATTDSVARAFKRDMAGVASIDHQAEAVRIVSGLERLGLINVAESGHLDVSGTI